MIQEPLSIPALRILPEALARGLLTISEKLKAGTNVRDDVPPVLEALNHIAPEDYARLSDPIALALCWYAHYPYGLEPAEQKRSFFAGLLSGIFGQPKKLTAAEQLATVEGLEYLLQFHRNGYLREAALRKMNGRLSSSFLFAALARRLNDWVPEVRRAAKECTLRVFLQTEAQVIADAAFDLMGKKMHWSRGSNEKGVLDQVFGRPDVLERFEHFFLTSKDNRVLPVFREVMRHDLIDAALPLLAVQARSAAVRALATQTLINGVARWCVGFGKQWTDRSLGRSHRVRLFEERPLTVVRDIEALIRQGLADKSAMVRRAALDGLARHHATIQDAAVLACPFAEDRRPSLRERAAYVLRQSEV